MSEAPGVTEYERLRDELDAELDAYRDGEEVDDALAGMDAYVATLEAEVARLREQIEAERAVLVGKWMLDADHAKEAMLALERLPYVVEENARLREALVDLVDTVEGEGDWPVEIAAARAAIDAARKEAGRGGGTTLRKR
jgi:hypothetical protein